jgi:hypothetical protein
MPVSIPCVLAYTHVNMHSFSALGIKGFYSENSNISTMISDRPAEVVSTSMLNVAETFSYECLL